ncbi:MAG: prepilin peptidase [Acetobacteraceae bacterium]
MSTLDWAAPFLFAPFAGSFLGVLVQRLPAGRGVIAGRSRCETCHRPLPARDLIPVLSFLLRRGRCRFCDSPINPLHLWIELGALLVPAGALWHARTPAGLWADCVLGWGLLALGWTDLRRWVLPDALTLPLLLAGLAAAAALTPDRLGTDALGAAAGWGGFALIGTLYRRLRGREGLGGGDAKLLGAGGAWLGVAALPTVVLAAALAGLVAALSLWRPGRRLSASTAIPFGPFLALAIWAIRLSMRGQ